MNACRGSIICSPLLSRRSVNNVGSPLPDKPIQKREAALPSCGRLVSASGKTEYVDSTLWKILKATGEEIPISNEGESETEEPNNPYTFPQDYMSATLFDAASPPRSLLELHSTYEAAVRTSRVYVEGVEPILKVLHKPTTEVIIQRAAAGPSSASRSTECLVFAHFAVMAMMDCECMKLLGQGRSKLLVKYHDALRYALINADFLRSTDIRVMQAYVLKSVLAHPRILCLGFLDLGSK